jgi:hypothetical protein
VEEAGDAVGPPAGGAVKKQKQRKRPARGYAVLGMPRCWPGVLNVFGWLVH